MISIDKVVLCEHWLWLKRCLQHEYTNLFLSPNFIFAAWRDAGQSGPRRLCFTNYAYQSVSTSAGGALTRANQSLSLWSLTNQSPVFRGEPFHENKPVSRGEAGPVHRASGLSIIGGVTQITIKVLIMQIGEEYNSRPRHPLIPELHSQADAPSIWGPPATIGVTLHCLVSRVLCLALSWKHQTKLKCINSKMQTLKHGHSLKQESICVFPTQPGDFAEVYNPDWADNAGLGCSLCLWQLSVRWQRLERLTAQAQRCSSALTPLSRPLSPPLIHCIRFGSLASLSPAFYVTTLKSFVIARLAAAH